MKCVLAPKGIRSLSMLVVLLGWLLMNTTGCAVLLLGAGAGAGAAGATYVMGKLDEEIDASVPRVRKATVSGLQSLELPLKKDQGDKLVAELESQTADQKTIWVSIKSLTPSRSQVTIRVGLLGDEVRSRRILGAIRAKL